MGQEENAAGGQGPAQPPPGGEPGYYQQPPPGGPGGYGYQPPPPPPPGWFYQDGQWYNQPYAPDGTCLVRDDRTMAMLAHVLMIVTGFIGPLILYFIKKDESRFVAFHSLQALYFSLISIVLAILTCGIWSIVVIILGIIMALKANEGKWERYWLAGDWAMSSIAGLNSRR